MFYARINLTDTNYQKLDCQRILHPAPISDLQTIYKSYCDHKRFKSVMPIFDSEFVDPKNDVIGYYDQGQLVAFSLMRRYDADNVEAIQFAWDYANPKLRLGIESLKSECALYKARGFRYLYLGEANEYKREIDCFEMLGPL